MTAQQGARYSRLRDHQLRNLPLGSVRRFRLDGVVVDLIKEGGSQWRVLSRSRVPLHHLAGKESREIRPE